MAMAANVRVGHQRNLLVPLITTAAVTAGLGGLSGWLYGSVMPAISAKTFALPFVAYGPMTLAKIGAAAGGVIGAIMALRGGRKRVLAWW